MKKKGVAQARTALLEAAAAVPVRLAHPEGLHLVLVGCGGTGSWLAPAVVRLARAWQEDLGWSVAVTPGGRLRKGLYRQLDGAGHTERWRPAP